MNLVVAVGAVMSAAAHLPPRPEQYREPTRLASAAWAAGWVHVTPAEVFAERTQGREPAVAPSHDGSCRVLLIADQQAPVQCAPPVEPLPAWCRGAGAMCFAIVGADGARYVRAPQNGFFYQVATATWPAGGPLAAAVQRVLHDADPAARVWRLDNPRRWRERWRGAEINVVLSRPGVSVVHIARATDAARRALDEDAGLQVIELLPARQPDAAALLTNLAVVARGTSR
jgi:hypothetical protein